MPSAQDYAQWIVDNQDKQGTPDFETVAKAFQISRDSASTPQNTQLQTPTSDEKPQTNRFANLGRTALSGLNKGIAGVGGLLVDTSENLVNLGLAGAGSLATAAGRPEFAPRLISGTPGGSQSIQNAMNIAGIQTANPQPNDRLSQVAHTGGEIAGASVLGGGVKSALKAAAGGALAEQVAGPEFVGVGAIGAFGAGQAVRGLKAGVARRAAPVVETFRQAGTTPSVGQALDNVFLHGLENLASKFPGGAGVMQKFIETQQASLGAKVRTGVSAEAAGRAIEKGISGEGGFLERTKATFNKLDQAVENKIPKGTAFKPSNTVKALDELTAPVRGAEQSTGTPLDTRITQIKTDFIADLQVNNGQMPYEALRRIRSRVGAQIDDALVQGAKSGEMSKLYGALSEDLKNAAQQAGASREFTRQNNFYRGRMNRIETVLDRVIGKGKQPEDIFKTFNPTDPNQANKVRATLRSLTPPERQVVTEAVVNRLGKVAPSKQDVVGELFSSETFLTNYNKLSLGARAQLFPEPLMRNNVSRVAQAASSIRTGQGLFANPSGTAGSFAAYSVYLSPLASVAAGSVAPVAAAAAASGTAYVGAKMLTSPRVVAWLATPISPVRPAEVAAHLVRLGVIYNSTNDDKLKEELATFITTAQEIQEAQEPRGTLSGINSALPPGPAAPRALPQPQSFVRG